MEMFLFYMMQGVNNIIIATMVVNLTFYSTYIFALDLSKYVLSHLTIYIKWG
jgi:hypothetical protein